MSRKNAFGLTIFILGTLGIFFVLRLIGTPIPAQAHAGGTYMKTQSGSSTIVIEYEGERIVQYGFTRFNISLLEATSSDTAIEVPYDAVWARIEHDAEILYAGWLYKPEGLLAGFS